MPRKLAHHIEAVRAFVRQREPDVPWVEIDGLAEAEVAARLSAHAIFFSTQNGEGFGLPAIEAMARGCVVTGYPGTGSFPHPYATRDNGLWTRDRSIRGAARQLCAAITIARGRGPALERLQHAGRRALAEYTEDHAHAALAAAAPLIAKGEYACRTALPSARLTVWGHLQAWRALLMAARLRRSTARSLSKQHC
jgi:glycosyltransferase involved in cell wall biosynthesis